VSVHLLNLEFNGVVKSLPGKMYALNIKLWKNYLLYYNLYEN
jgi:hypothetical protein